MCVCVCVCMYVFFERICHIEIVKLNNFLVLGSNSRSIMYVRIFKWCLLLRLRIDGRGKKIAANSAKQ